ncbi:NUDIX hydrolase [Halorussus ruber]|uniref:NUDIX hydrolase n=1 Tax=Halorussus ruber TaxID=1126238 RepID=UPI0010924228|nr:NUDIX domain-containing protein [Halorussus ruber]
MTERAIRVVARGLVRRTRGGTEELLVARERDPTAGESFYYLLGGGVEFGEHSEEALRREFREELGVELADISSLGTYENVFTFEGRAEHEIWRVYDVEISDGWPYQREQFTASEPDGEAFECVWKPVCELEEDGEPFYPEAALADL